MSIFFLATEICWSERYKSCYAIWFVSLFKINFLRNFRFQLLHQDPNWFFMKLSQISRLKSSRSFLLHQNLDCTKVRKLILMMTYFSTLLFCVATGLASPMNVLIESPIVVVGYSIECFFFLIHALHSWCPETHWRFLVSKHVVPQKNVSPLVQASIIQSRSQSKKFNF